MVRKQTIEILRVSDTAETVRLKCWQKLSWLPKSQKTPFPFVLFFWGGRWRILLQIPLGSLQTLQRCPILPTWWMWVRFFSR